MASPGAVVLAAGVHEGNVRETRYVTVPSYPDPEVYVRLRILGDFVPVDVTRRLALTPSDSYDHGSLVGNGSSGRRHVNAGWFLSSEQHVMSSEIEPHLTWLLSSIEPRAVALAELFAEGCSADVDCFWSSVGMSGGPWLAPETMSRLGGLKLPLVVSFYALDLGTD